MLSILYSRFFLITSLFVLFIFNSALANNNFFQCLEKISEVRSGNNLVFKKGATFGTSYVKIKKNKNFVQEIIVHFKLKNSEEKPNEIISKKNVNSTSLGFNVDHSYSLDSSTSDISYNFIKIDDTYVFKKKNFSWSSTENQHDFDTTSRCKNLSKEKYLSLIDSNKPTKTQSYNWAAISKHPNSNKEFISTELSSKEKAINFAMKKCYKFVTNNLNKVGYNDCYLFKVSDDNFIKVSNKITKKSKSKITNNISGTRPFALSWEGVDELIIGQLSFQEENLIGKLDFILPVDESKCIGTYVLSTSKGTWSILCEKNDMNASGLLKWNSKNGNVSGNGEDSKGKKVKFKVSGKN